VESESGGRNGSLVFKFSNSLLILVCNLSNSIFPRNSNLISSLTAGFIYFASYTYFTSTYWPWLPNSGKCAGEEFAAFAGIISITSYLVLFIFFYIATYKKDGKRPTGRKAARSLKDAEVPDVAALTHGKINPMANGSTNGHATTTGATPGRPVTRSRKA
jgi:hypothetical protein